MALEVRLKPVETLLFRSDVVAAGKFRCDAADPLFRDSGPCSHHTFVFPRTFTQIHQEGRAPFVAGPGSVVLYNQHQRYTRTKLSGVDASDWYTLADDVLFELTGRDSAPFAVAEVPAGSREFLEQRMIFDALDRGVAVDPLHVDETMLRILSSVVRRRERVRPSRTERDAVDCVRERIARDPSCNTSLRALARSCGLSPFQLCRLFRARTGSTLTRYRHVLRLHLSLERLRDSALDLTTLALDLGYSSHSHFTAVFRRYFGITPSGFREGSLRVAESQRGCAPL